MDKIYVVYSKEAQFGDYALVGAYTDSKTAEVVRNLFSEDAYTDEININEIPKHVEGKVPWKLVYGKYNNYYSLKRTSIKNISLKNRYVKSHFRFGDGNTYLEFYVWAKDAQEASTLSRNKRDELVKSNQFDNIYGYAEF